MTAPTLAPDQLNTLTLTHGGHSARDQGVCLMEAVAWAAGEPHSDHPRCVSPVLTSMGMRLNDNLDDTERQQLKPYIFKVIGTRGDGKDPARRRMARDWLMTSALPEWLELANRPDLVEQCRAAADLEGNDLYEAIASIRDLTYKARAEARQNLTEQVKAKLLEKWAAEGKAVAVAAVVAAVAADAADAAAAADADAAVAVDAAAVAVAVDAAAVDAAAVAVADAAAAAAAAEGKSGYSDVWNAVYYKMREYFRDQGLPEKVQALRAKQLTELFDLYDRMIAAA
jgi:hypothetical protein